MSNILELHNVCQVGKCTFIAMEDNSVSPNEPLPDLQPLFDKISAEYRRISNSNRVANGAYKHAGRSVLSPHESATMSKTQQKAETQAFQRWTTAHRSTVSEREEKNYKNEFMMLAGHIWNPGNDVPLAGSRDEPSAFSEYGRGNSNTCDQNVRAVQPNLTRNAYLSAMYQCEICQPEGIVWGNCPPGGLFQTNHSMSHHSAEKSTLFSSETSEINGSSPVKKNAVNSNAWMGKFAQLKAYVEKHQEYPAISSGALGKWVSAQKSQPENCRNSSDRILKSDPPESERRRLLESLPRWTWDCKGPTYHHNIGRGMVVKLTPLEERYQNRWMKVYNKMRKYVDEHGALPSTKNGSLGKWIRTQRVAYQSAKHPSVIRRGWPSPLVFVRKTLLEKLPGWSWDDTERSASRPNMARWMQRFNELSDFLGRNSGMYPAAHWKKSISFECRHISLWISTQIAEYKRGNLSDERIAYLNSLAGWSFVNPLNRVRSNVHQ